MSEEKNPTGIIDPSQSPSLKNWGKPISLPKEDVYIECGWGRLIFGHTFKSQDDILALLKQEQSGARDLALYIRDPQVLLAKAPQDLFIDPSYTYRITFYGDKTFKEPPGNFSIRQLEGVEDIEQVNRIYMSQGMVPVDPEFIKSTYNGEAMKYWVAVEKDTDVIIAVCMGIDHKLAFDDPENGASLWSLAVDPNTKHARVGIRMVQHIANYFKKQKRNFMDLSVLHSNAGAIALYKKLGFKQIPVFCVKNKNALNENLFLSTENETGLSAYSTIIINEAKRRGIRVEVLDAEDNYFKLSTGGRSITCRESLSAMTSSIAMSRCGDKYTTSKIMKEAGLKVPIVQMADTPAKNLAFLEKHKRIVVKPATGEPSLGVTLDVKTKKELGVALDDAHEVSQKVILQEMIDGENLRVIVINYQVVAAAIRKPPVIIGDGEHTILDLVHKQSRRREQATQGQSKITIDDELRHTVNNAGYSQNDILPKGEELVVKATASLHQGGTLHDVTDFLHPEIAKAAVAAAEALYIPVVGMDFIVKSPSEPEYVIIQANERPGLANHEPQPTAERFVDLLFPQSMSASNNPDEEKDAD